MLLPIALSLFGQLVTPVLSPSAPAPLPGWSWEGGFYQPSELGAAQTSPTPTWSCGAKLLTGRDIVGSNLIQSDCDSFNTNPAEEYDPTNGKYLVPCVVHVITDGSTGFLSLSCVQNNIDTMNQDFLALSGTPGQLGTDAQIEFYLADVDPSGNPTNGVTYTDNAEWFQEADPLEPSTLEYRTTLSWDPDRYVNIYVLQINWPASGYVYLPVDPCNCVAGNPLYDGVHVDHRYWGNCSQYSAWAAGRVLTHEMGHYLGLFHTFEGGCDSGLCSESGDLICDTNPEADPASGCGNSSSCGSPDPDRNYMDYGDPYCSLEFTPNQIRRMRCVLESYRPQLGTLVFPGACCFEDGSCELATESACGDVGGTYQGEGSACEPNNCPQPPTLGACCLPDLSCSEVETAECATLGGDYKGDDSVCASFNCAAGACCFGLDACTFVIESQCDAAGGDFRGAGSACDTEDCTLPVGACCLAGVCIPEFDPSLCVSSGGEFQGEGSDCAADPCAVPPATGACCFANGSCVVETESDCGVNGGIYSGDNTSCTPNPCPQPPATGACCATDGSCSEQTEADCQSSGGSYSGDGTVCAPNPCPQPPATGACCASDGSCSVQTQADCSASGGVYQGDDTACDSGVVCDDLGQYEWLVDDDLLDAPNADFTSIQSAIDAASDGDVIVVYPGTYLENSSSDWCLNINDLDVKILAVEDRSVTVDGQNERGFLRCVGNVSSNTVVQGIQFTNASISRPMMSFFGNNPSPTIQECSFKNLACRGLLLSGPENCCNGGEATFDSCVFSSIDIVDQAYGIYADYSSLNFQNCVFSDISTDLAFLFAYWGSAQVAFTGCVFNGLNLGLNQGSDNVYGLFYTSNNAGVSCESCTFFGNTNQSTLGDCLFVGAVALQNCVVCDNSSPLCSYADLGGNVDCPVDLGACCVSGECLNLTEDICRSVGGSFKGSGSSCSEFDCTDCNNDGLDDLGQIQSGTLKDYDGNLVPDVCEAVQWSVESGGNGHWYQAVNTPQISWTDARSFSSEIGGHLATLTSAAENQLMLNLLPAIVTDPGQGYWIGAQSNGAGSFEWVTGEAFDFTSWGAAGACNEQPDGRDAVDVYCVNTNGAPAWSDDYFDWINARGFVAEWSADCNNDGLVDFGQLITGALEDKNNDGVPDCCADGQTCEPDCDGDGIPDQVEIDTGEAGDQNQNGIPDNCEPDCDGDGIPDFVEILQGAFDCNANAIPDTCEIADGTAEDANGNTFLDECEVDCNGNGFFDFLDLFTGGSQDCDGNNVPDECDIADGTQQDCNADGVPDACTSFDDCDTNGVPDECQPDTDQDGEIDACDSDDDGDDVPDECDPDSTGGSDCDLNGIDDICDPDADGDMIPDACDDDIDGDGVPNECDLDSAPSAEIANSMSDFSNVQGQSNWSYLWQSETGAISEYSFYGTRSCRQRTRWASACTEVLPNLTKEGWQIKHFCGSCGGIQPVRRYTFTNNGIHRLEIDGAEASFTESVEFVIRLNGQVLASFVQEDFPLAYEAELVVQEGDELDLALLDASSSSICGCDVYCDAVVKLFDSSDCNSNGIIDSCELDGNDCNSNGVPDDCELAGNDCNANGVPDECDLVNGDCNTNSIPDVCEQDTDGDTIPDDCDDDIDGDGIPNECDVDQYVPLSADSLTGFSDVQGQDGWRYRYSVDQDLSSLQDLGVFIEFDECSGGNTEYQRWKIECDNEQEFISSEYAHPDQEPVCVVPVVEYSSPYTVSANVTVTASGGSVVGDGVRVRLLLGETVLDTWVLTGGQVQEVFPVVISDAQPVRLAIDSNGCFSVDGDGVRYRITIDSVQEEIDCNTNGVLDLCELDTDSDGTIDDCDPDDDNDGVPDECDPDSTGGSDCDANGIDDLCELGDDCNSNSVPDRCESDLDKDGVIDDCDPDDDDDGIPDECDSRWTGGEDCNANGIDDTCEPDLDEDGTIDACDPDIDGDGVPNECDVTPGSGEIFFYANSKEDFAGIQGNNGWRYRWSSLSSLEDIQDISIFDETGECVGHPEPRWNVLCEKNAYVGATIAHPERSPCVIPVIEYTSPFSGDAYINVFVFDHDGSSGDGTRIRLFVDDHLIDTWLIGNVGATIDADFTVPVQQYSKVRLAFDSNGCSSIDGDGVMPVLQVSSYPLQTPGAARQWKVEDGGNGHWYMLSEEGQLTWFEARSRAVSLGGYLATVTSQEEEDFRNTFFDTDSISTPWIGGYTEGNSSWKWITGESWGYTNWAPSEPNNSGTRAIMGGLGDCSGCGWYDYRPESDAPFVAGLMIEWSADCNNDGIVDYGQILDGTFADDDQNGVPDCCDQGVPCSSPSGEDCNANGVLDSCELEDNDCNANGIPDDCEMFDDCNANGLGDPCDIAAGTSQDINADGVPDECQCIADFVSDGVVDFQEVLAILNDWGPCGPPCPPDINADGVVSFIDLLRVLDAWGPCDP